MACCGCLLGSVLPHQEIDLGGEQGSEIEQQPRRSGLSGGASSHSRYRSRYESCERCTHASIGLTSRAPEVDSFFCVVPTRRGELSFPHPGRDP